MARKRHPLRSQPRRWRPGRTRWKLGLAAERFVAAFNERDAAGLAALFMPNAEIHGQDGAVISGRVAIEEHYAELFAEGNTPAMALEAAHVHFITPDIAVEYGVVHLTRAEDEPVRSISYTATQVRQPDGHWLIAFSNDKQELTPPAEHIKPLLWLAGEWTLEEDDGVRVDMSIGLDAHGNYLLGEALMTSAEGDAQSISMRIGWNPATSSIHWWNFDSEGGHSSGHWARQGDRWLIQNTGVIASNEATSSSHALTREGPDTMVWEATHRIAAGQSLPDMGYRFVRRAPDPSAKIRESGN